ncbi:N-acetylglucosamine-6-phosphate deacetylase [Flavisolibacter tropicus]|uniref:N-acetylglucosamine-6-phosphate deacetylase n=1 Tax=Flavisolibacter tropicus TaxID=1492898 RepID=A0A172TXT0_9BACT|nr:N-acetylglucosamine-6-phosphate deacetylase [Flavisolibacter tropicus]ANE51899.1 N-acetylglucosamine-6-phosphate deacetylase [Flavisolibacter tropicus]
MAMQYYTADRVFTGEEWLENMVIQTIDGRIQSLLPADSVDPAAVQRFDHGSIIPAFLDIQLYGAHGRLLAVYPDPETLFETVDYCLKGGAVLCLPTVATNSKEVFFKCIDAVRAYWQEGGPGVWGLHLEGPWLNPVKRGAHVEAFIHPPTVEEVKEILEYGNGIVKMITLAPEVCSDEVIQLIQSYGITISAGHSNATFAQATAAFDKGVHAVTHLYNAMSALQHREPGLVGATFLHPQAKASIIPDGHHASFEAIRIAKQLMGDRLFTITDAVTETTEGYYQHEKVGDKYECNGTLSGSALTQHQSMLNLVNKVGIELGEAIRMCSLYPAQVIGADEIYGKIAPGYTAQFLVLNNDLTLSQVIL